jgi:hypothetical protein
VHSEPYPGALGSSYLPLHADNADLAAGLFVIVEPLVFAQVDARELGARLCTGSEELSLWQVSLHPRSSTWQFANLCLELGKLEPSTVELEYVDCLRRVCLWICSGRGLDARRVFPLQDCQGMLDIAGTGTATLQFLHRQTKFASPLLPLTSFFSKRLTEMKLGCVSRHDVHCTLNV